MKPKSNPLKDQFHLFQASFQQMLNPNHPLVQMADKINWERFENELQPLYAETGRPGAPIRLLVSLCYLKYAFNVSDEDMQTLWVENPYWQYFSGYGYMQHEFPIDYTTWEKWRKRMGHERLESLLAETIDLAVREKQLKKSDCKRVTIDTTVQEKNITHPSDSKLLYKAIVKLGKAAGRRNIILRQSYVRVGKRASVKAGRYAHARQFKRMRREIRRLKTFMRRMLKDIERKAGTKDSELGELLGLCWRLHDQQPRDKGKLYSLHEPHVQCVSKGKAAKRYEFGNKVTVATTNRSNWIVGMETLAGNPYDGHTLVGALATVERVTGVRVEETFVDKGYRGHKIEAAATKVHISGMGRRDIPASLKKRKRRRSAVEPKIGHLKSENRMARCYLAGFAGDQLNAILAGAGSNFRKILRRLRIFARIYKGWRILVRTWLFNLRFAYAFSIIQFYRHPPALSQN